MSMYSSTPLRAASTSGPSVHTSMPSATGHMQETSSLREFETFTRHMRQLPCGCSPGCQQ